MKAVFIKIYGEVVGVNFRYYTRELARELGVNGWVRNVWRDRSVEMWVEGEEDKLEKMITWAKTGPRRARVERVEAEERRVEGVEGFEIKISN